MKQESTAGSSSQLLSTSRRCSLRWDGFHPFLVAFCVVFCLSCCLPMSDGVVVSCSLKDSASGIDDKLHLGKRNDGEGVVSCKEQHVHGVWIRTSSGQKVDKDENSEEIEIGVVNGSSPLRVEISPPVLDWGKNTLYSPSLAFLSVANSYKDGDLHVYDLFSTDLQFYAYDFANISLAPGESVLISFVFLPRWLGLSSAHLVMQTNLGGFVIHAKGLAIECPYHIEPLVGLAVPFDGSLNRTISLYNPSDSVVYVEEATAWISISNGNVNHSATVVCSINEPRQSSDKLSSFRIDKEWLTIKSCDQGLSLVDIRPHEQWEVPPHNAEAIMEMNFWPHLDGEIFGSICIQLQNSMRDGADSVIVPIKVEVHGRKIYHDLTGLLSVFLEPHVSCEEKGSIISLSVRNDASYLLSVEEISEVTEDSKLFQVNYMKGLILYPKTVTRIALIGYTLSGDPHSTPSEVPSVSLNCELILVTNNSASPQIKVPCQDLVRTFSKYQPGSSSAVSEGSYNGLMVQQENERSVNTRGGPLGSIVEEPVPMKQKLIEVVKADELIRRNWRSQGTMSGTTVLEDHEVLFPVLQTGTHFSKGTIVRNTSWKLVTMQLVLNSGAIVDQCKSEDDLSIYGFLSRFDCIGSREKQDGLPAEDLDRTEAFLHPLGSTLVGPAVSRPSQKCMWRSLALIWNDLSSIEWWRSFGGSQSLVLLEGSEPVGKVEFNLNLPISANISSWDLFSYMETTSASSGNLLSEELCSKVTGKLPLEVLKLQISGSKCGLGGSVIHICEDFAPAPGESIVLPILSRVDSSAAMVHRDLDLAMVYGIFVIPMKATLPVYMLNLCRKSFFCSVFWNLTVLVLAAVSVVFLVFVRIIPHALSPDTGYYFDKNTVTTISTTGKLSRLHRNSKKFNSRSVGEDEKPEAGFVASRYSNCPNDAHDNNKRMQSLQDVDHQNKITSSPPPSTTKPVMLLDSTNTLERPHSADLTVRIVRERGRRRKRRTTGASLAAKFEVSSSQSGNSTPSSPLTPNASAPKQIWPPSSPDTADSTFSQVLEQNHQKRHEAEVAAEARAPEAEKHYSNTWLLSAQDHVTLKSIGRPTLLPCATFPGPGRHAPGVAAPNFVASTSPIAPHARAPGSKLIKDEAVKREETDVLVKEFTYDIWGNHFSDHFLGRPKEIVSKVFDASEGDSQSFFAREPQSLMMMPSARSVTPGHKLAYYDVNRLYQMD